MTERPRIGIVGAGPAGLSCGQALRGCGFDVVILEKSRGIGGRMATRRRDGFQFDHGAPCASLGSPAARPWVEAARQEGLACDWPEGGVPGNRAPVLGLPGMSSLCQPLASGLDIRFQEEVVALTRSGAGWRMQAEAETHDVDQVILAIPAPQVARIDGDLEAGFLATLSGVDFAPCYTLMVAFDGAVNLPAVIPDPAAPFALVLRDSAKPGRSPEAECWVAHATEAWSRAHLEMERPEAAALLLDEFTRAAGPLPPVRICMGHRWRFARVARSPGCGVVASSDGTVLAGGDWALGRMADDAVRSGLAMAERVMRRFGVSGAADLGRH
jgi:predicted NAD/FAD-dependent oxidoreductase